TSLQSCAEESIFLESARRRKAASLSNPPCSFVPRNLAPPNLLEDAGAKQVKEFLIPSKPNETKALCIDSWPLRPPLFELSSSGSPPLGVK
ncbi:hypothetical protein P9857_13450, partial [Anoxybacillus geothermalis]|nr:hypothetical protein [Anoxybacillus geothermalis]